MDSIANISNDPRKPEIPQYMEFEDFKTPGLQFDTDGYSQATLPQTGAYSPSGIFLPTFGNMRELTKNITDGEIDWSQDVKIGKEGKYTRFDLMKLCKDVINKTTIVDEKGNSINYDRLLSLLEKKENSSKIYYEGKYEGNEINNIRDLELLNKIHSDDLDIPVLKSLKEIYEKGSVFADSKGRTEITLYDIYKRIEKDGNNLGLSVDREQVNNISDLLSLSYLYCDKNKPKIKDLPEDKRVLLKSLIFCRERDMSFADKSEYGAYKALSQSNAEKIILSTKDDSKIEISSIPSFYGELESQVNPTKELLLDGYGLKDVKLVGDELPKMAADLILGIVKNPNIKTSARELAELYKNCVKLSDYIPNKVFQKTDGKKLENEIFNYFKLMIFLDKKKQGEYLSQAQREISNGNGLIATTKALRQEVENVLNGLYDKSTFGRAFKVAGRAIGAVGGALAGFAAGNTWGLGFQWNPNGTIGGFFAGYLGGWAIGMAGNLIADRLEKKGFMGGKHGLDIFLTPFFGGMILGPIIGGSGAHITATPNAFSAITATALGAAGGSYLGGLAGDKLGLEVYKVLKKGNK